MAADTPEVAMRILFNKPFMTGKELWYISQAHANGHLAGDGEFTRKCNAWLEQRTGCRKALLTHSCTAALEIAAILADIQPGGGDHAVVHPSFPRPTQLSRNQEHRFGGRRCVAGWGNFETWLLVRDGMRFDGIPHACWHPLHRIAMRNDPEWPISTWVVAQK